MSKIKNGGLDQYGAEAFEQQQFGTAGVEGVKTLFSSLQFKNFYRLVAYVINITARTIVVY